MTTDKTAGHEGSMTRVGSRCSLLAGVIYIISGAGYFVSQTGRFDWNSIRSISEYLARVPSAWPMWILVNVGAAIASLIAVAGVQALADEMRPAGEGWVRWTSTLAIIGYAILAVSNMADLYQIRQITSWYLGLDPSAQSAVEAMGRGSLDPTLSLRFLTIGPWFLVGGWLALRSGRLPRVLAAVGVFGGVAALLAVLVSLLEIQALTGIAGAVALVLHPLWLIWTGLVLRRRIRVTPDAPVQC